MNESKEGCRSKRRKRRAYRMSRIGTFGRLAGLLYLLPLLYGCRGIHLRTLVYLPVEINEKGEQERGGT